MDLSNQGCKKNSPKIMVQTRRVRAFLTLQELPEELRHSGNVVLHKSPNTFHLHTPEIAENQVMGLCQKV